MAYNHGEAEKDWKEYIKKRKQELKAVQAVNLVHFIRQNSPIFPNFSPICRKDMKIYKHFVYMEAPVTGSFLCTVHTASHGYRC